MTTPKITPPTEQQLYDRVSQYLGVQNTGLAFVIGYASPQFSPNTAFYWKGNLANQSGQSLTLDATTPFELASVTKTFTGTLYALLMQSQSNQNLKLGDFMVSNGGPLNIGQQFAGIPLSDLMSYTSGLPTDNVTATCPAYLPQPYTRAGMLGYLNMTSMTPATPGQSYTYSNLGFAIMAAVLPHLTTGSANYRELVQQKIFAPLSMKAAMFVEDVQIDQFAQVYNYSGPTSYGPTAPGWPLFPAYNAAGGIVATPNDMMPWLLSNMGILKNASLTPLLAKLQSPATGVTWGPTQLGLSWFISPGWSNGATTVWKDGGFLGTNSFIALLQSPDPGNTPSQAGVFVLTNASGIVDSDGNEIVSTIANDLLLIMQGITPPTDKSVYPRTPRAEALRA